jgi:hypothetical protein
MGFRLCPATMSFFGSRPHEKDFTRQQPNGDPARPSNRGLSASSTLNLVQHELLASSYRKIR